MEYEDTDIVVISPTFVVCVSVRAFSNDTFVHVYAHPIFRRLVLQEDVCQHEILQFVSE